MLSVSRRAKAIQHSIGELYVPLTPFRVVLALASSALMTLGIAVNSLHWSGIEPTREFGIVVLIGLVVALLVIFSSTFAASMSMRVGSYLVMLIAACVAGSGTWAGRIVVGIVFLTVSLGLPRLWQILKHGRSKTRKHPTFRRKLRPPPAFTFVSLGLLLTVVGGLAHQPGALAAVQSTTQGIGCGSASFNVSRNGEPIDLSGDQVVIELPGQHDIYEFEASASRAADVSVALGSIEPWVFTDDVVLWAGTIRPGEPAGYVVDIRRSGLLGVYEIRFGEERNQLDRGPVPAVAGTTTLTAEFVFLDGGQPQECQVTIEIRLRAEPHATLFGLTSLVVTSLICTSLSPSRQGSVLPPNQFKVTSVTVGNQPALGNGAYQRPTVTPTETEPFSVTLRAKLDENKQEIDQRKLTTKVLKVNELLTVIDLKGSVSAASDFTEISVTGFIRAGHEPGVGRFRLEVDYLTETTRIPVEVVVGERPFVDLRAFDPDETTETEIALASALKGASDVVPS